jgi:Phage late control gene D protein (GPD).
MYVLNWHITIGKYRLKTLKSVKITASVLNLSDTATIELPGQYLNTWQKIEGKVSVGDAVEIKLGYGDDLQTEFKGYLKRISRDNNSLVLECEDALYLLNKSIKDKEYKQVNIKSLLTDVLHQVDAGFSVECDYNYTLEKFVAFHHTALDVLKKVHDETKANIWFEDKTLHIHPVYAEKADETAVIYDTRVNVQSNELKWIDKNDKKVEIEVVYNLPNGDKQKETYGTSGGEKVTRYVNGSNAAEMKTAAENEYKLWNYSGFEGSFTAWLIPKVKAGGSVRLRDVDKDEGKYYVTGVEIEFGQNGAKRKVTLGRKLG